MSTEKSYSIETDFLYLFPLQTSTALAKFLMLDLSTDFSRMVYNSRLIDYDNLTNLNNKVKQVKPGEELSLLFSNVLLVFTCAYITACFTQNKEAFYKWFLTYEKGGIDDSNNFREITQVGQLALTAYIEELLQDDSLFREKKQELIYTFGALS